MVARLFRLRSLLATEQSIFHMIFSAVEIGSEIRVSSWTAYLEMDSGGAAVKIVRFQYRFEIFKNELGQILEECGLDSSL